MNTTKLVNHQDTKSTKPKDLGVLGGLGGSTRPPLPPGWRWVRLGEVCRQDRRIVEPGSPLPYLSLEHVEAQTGRILKETANAVEDEGKSTTFAFDSRHVLYGKLRPYLNKVALPDFAGRCTTEMIPLLPTGLVLREFLAWALRRPEVVEAAMREKTGSRMPRADMDELMKVEIPLPPLAEQERLVGVLRERLGAVARARRAAEEQLVAARALPAAYLRAVFNSPEAEEWPRAPFGELVENHDGRRIPVKLEDRRKRKGPYPYYGASGVIDYIDDFLFDGEYLLLAEDGANLLLRSSPIAFKATGKFWVNNHAHVVRPKDGILLDYLLHFFAVTNLRPYVTGTAQPKLTQADLNSIPVPVPPLERQHRLERELSARLAEVERLRRVLEERLAAIEALPAALLRQAFRGEL